MIRVGGRRSILCAASVAFFILSLVACGGTGPQRSDTGNTSAGIPTKSSSATQTQFHALSVSASPATGGSITSNPGGINCGATCSTSFVAGSTIALTVAPKTGFIFTGWGGACSGTSSCSVKIDSDKSVTASFGPPPPAQATLTVAESGGGAGTITSSPAGINCGSTCSAALNVGTSVVLTATPGPGSSFAGWSGAACAGVGTCTVALTTDASVMALFVPQFTLSVSQAGTGSGSVTSVPAGILCGATCSAGFAANTVVTLTANPAAGSAFTGWGGACSGTGSCTVTMASNQAVVANFGPPPTPQFNVTVTAPATGTVTSAPAGINCGGGNTTCSAPFNSGSSLTLTAVPQAGNVFTGWTGSVCAGTAACTFTVTANETIGANFAPLYTVTVGLAGTGTGTVTSAPAGINCGVTCSSSFQSGTVVTLAATPAAGSVFTGWGGACSGNAGCTLTLAGNQNVTATFGPVPVPKFALTTSITGSGSVTSSPAGISCGATCSADFDQNTVVTLNPTAQAGAMFSNWSGGCSGSGACSVTMNSAQSVGATFIPSSYPVSVTIMGGGSGSVTGTVPCGSGTCTNPSVAIGTNVSLTATPLAGSVFGGWTLSPPVSVSSCNSTSATCTFTTEAAAETATAVFTAAPNTLTVIPVNNGGTGSVTSNVGAINCPGTCSDTYTSGTSVILTAAPAASSQFAGWGGACSGTGTCTVTMNSAQSVSATFIPASFPVNVATAGAGSGSVTSNVGGISCTSTSGTASGTCNASLNSGTAVTLTATPASTYSVFAGWTGDCSGTGTCALNVTNSALNVTATFSPAPQSTLTVSTTGGGSGTVTSAPAGINCGATCSANYLNGTPVTLTASAAAGSVFTGWSGGACAGTGTCAVTMNTNTSVTASFVPLYTLSVTTAGTGTVTSSPAGINCGATCSSTFNAGTAVSLAAAPGAGQVFSGWSGACSGTGACNVTLNSSQSVTATFAAAPPPQYSVTLTTSGASTGTITSSPSGINCGTTCTASFNSGTSVTLTATPAAGYSFSGWSGSSCAGTGTCTVIVTSNVSATATFVTQFTLSVALAGTGTGTVSSSPAGINCGATCSMTSASGSSISLTATPNSGQVFSGWSGACTGKGSCSVSMTSNQSVTATFNPAPPPSYSVTISLAGSGSGTVTSSDGNINCGTVCSANYTSGSNVTLDTTPATGSAFAGWISAYCSGTDPCTLPVTSAQSLTANFTPVQPLFVTVNGAGSVTSNPAGIACPSQCAANFIEGTSVTLTPVASNGYSFSGWSGACTGSGSCVVTMSASESVSADFTQNQYSTAAPFLTVTPSPFSFGPIQIGTTSIQTVQVSNTGDPSGGDLIISSATIDNPAFAIQPGQLPMTIAPGSAQALSISFTPSGNGSATGTVSFVSNASNPTTTLSISGNGSTSATASGGFAVSPTILFFGNVNVGSTVTQTITMSNPGTANTVVSAATVSGSGLTIVSPAFPLTLAPGASQAVVIQFAPQNTGSVTGVITFTSNAASSPVVSVVASANGSTPVTSVLAYPSTLNFGAVPLGIPYAENVVLYNTGNTTVTVFSPSISGAGFTISNAGYPFTLPVNGTLAFTVFFTPLTAGTSTGTLTFNTNATIQPTATLTGTGVFVTPHTATLSWCPSSSQVIGYNVYRSTTSGSGYQLLSFVASTASTCSTPITFVDSNVISGQTYYWVVTAVNAGGTESTYSNEASATIP